jgi:hypothetical protein
MDPISRNVAMGAAGGGVVLPAIGASFEGGYYAGLISQTANGVATHALIVAPASSGYNNKNTLQLKTSNTNTPGTNSDFNGAANSAAMNDASHPAAQYCEGLTIGGFSDWYLPAKYELDIAYQNLKPTTQSNSSNAGSNPYSVPPRPGNRSASVPAQTSVTLFQSGNSEAFSTNAHWSSTDDNGGTWGWYQAYSDGFIASFTKTSSYLVRAFRKIAI